MTKRYTGGVISSSLPTVNAAGASGVFLLSQQADAQSRNSWPPYKIEESLRFRSSASAYLNRTPASAGNRKTWTYSVWFKRGALGSAPYLFGATTDSWNVNWTLIYFNSSNTLNIQDYSSSERFALQPTMVFRDPSAWYHLVVSFDSTQATSSNRIKVYINGSQITAFNTATYPSQNLDTFVNNAVGHQISGTGGYFDGYMSEVNFVDGQALTPSAFGATDKDGNWSPIAYTGTYGTNGFYVNFRDNTSATTVGYDYSGNGNNWTLNGFNVSTANTTYDIMIDVPEDQSDGTANNRGNYATLNSLHGQSTSGWVTPTFSNGSLSISTSLSNNQAGGNYSFSTQQVTSGKWYAEFTCGTRSGIPVAGNDDFGVVVGIAPTAAGSYSPDIGVVYKATNGQVRIDGAGGTSYGNSYTTGDVIGVALDMDNGKVWFAKNGTWQASGDPAAGTNQAASSRTGLYGIGLQVNTFANAGAYTTSASANFGQRPFAYAPPTGFKSLNTFNLPEPTIKQPSQYMNATLWSGNNTNNREIITGGRSDFVWIKRRDSATSHILFDAIRGAGKTLYSHLTSAEVDNGGYYVQTFGTTSFTLGTGGDAADNITGGTYVGWSWNAGGSTVTNTSGSISAQVRANPTAGFSIVTYTGTGSNATIGHGLGVAPSMYIVKRRNAVDSWFVYSNQLAATQYLRLESTNAAATFNFWQNTAPTSSVFYISTDVSVNASSDTYVAYCFAPIAGYSAFGSYTGNASTDGPFIYTGFRPRFLLTKRSDATESWRIGDSSRSPYNAVQLELFANLSNAEENNSNQIDYLSNGFKIRTSSSSHNASGGTYIYMAFAEMPFKYARAR